MTIVNADINTVILSSLLTHFCACHAKLLAFCHERINHWDSEDIILN